MNINEAFPSRYLKTSDLPEEGVVPFTIEKIVIEEIGQGKDRKPVIHFEETNKALVCNKTNARTIARVLGSEECDDWTGKIICLYRAEVEFQGEMVESIRVRLKKPTAAAKPQKEESDNIPF